MTKIRMTKELKVLVQMHHNYIERLSWYFDKGDDEMQEYFGYKAAALDDVFRELGYELIGDELITSEEFDRRCEEMGIV